MNTSAVLMLGILTVITAVNAAPFVLRETYNAHHTLSGSLPTHSGPKLNRFNNGDKQTGILQMQQSPSYDNRACANLDHTFNNNQFDQQGQQAYIESLAQCIVKTYAENKSSLNKLNIEWSCDVCIVMVKLIQEVSKFNWTKDEIAALVTKECINLKIDDSRVCKGAVRLFRGEVLAVLTSGILKPTDVCGRAFGSACSSPYDPDQMWTVPLPDVPKPPVISPPFPKPGSPTLRVLHLTDIHVDPEYTVNRSVDCGEPICCRQEDPPLKSGGAPQWGSYGNCDLPRRTLDSLFLHLAQNEQFDYIVFTGDIPAHYVWESSKSDTVRLMVNLTHQFLKYFPGKPVFFSLGNHEAVPVNSFPPPWQVVPPTERSDWLYDTAIATWRHWLPNDTFPTIKRGGFYTTLVKPGLRIVSLNMNFANSMNWWLLINTTDPVGQLSWLVGVLQDAETAGEKVQIIGHIPPGLCTKPWSWAFYEIVNRYESTIVGQFYGHTHADGYSMFYDPASNLTRPTSVGYVAPAVEAGPSGNNGYRVYSIDGERANSTWQVLDHETYVMNLSQANAGNSPKWIKSYSAKALYNMSSLQPREWDDLLNRMSRDEELFQKYNRNTRKQHVFGPCDSGCRKQTLCGIRTSRPGDPDLCKHLNVTHTQHAKWRRDTELC